MKTKKEKPAGYKIHLRFASGARSEINALQVDDDDDDLARNAMMDRKVWALEYLSTWFEVTTAEDAPEYTKTFVKALRTFETACIQFRADVAAGWEAKVAADRAAAAERQARAAIKAGDA